MFNVRCSQLSFRCASVCCLFVGNIAYNRSWGGDHSLYSGAFLKRHSSLWRLTDRGKEQAICAGQWKI
jgi:hypothetical protein